MFKKIVLVVILIVGGVLLQDHESSASWVTTTVESKETVGKWTSIALDSNDKIHISYLHGYPNYQLRYANNVPGAWNTSVLDSGQGTGTHSSIAIDSSDKVHISYYDNYPIYDLKYATNSSGIWVTSTIDSTGRVGSDTSIAIDSNNKVHISYRDESNGDLKYANNVFDTWDVTTLDSVGLVGEYSSIAIDSNNKVHITYYDRTNGDLKYATNSSEIWTTTTVDSTGDIGEYTSIAIDSNNKVHISYYDRTNGDLRYVTDFSGIWVATTVDSVGDVGQYTSIAIDPNNQAHISYYDVTNSSLTYAVNISGTWVATTLDNSGDVGMYTSIAIDSNNYVHISYLDGYNSYWNLKYATNVPLVDNDGDGYTSNIDCNDNDPTINPSAVEGPFGNVTCSDGKDNNCDHLIDAADPLCAVSQPDLIISSLSAPLTAMPSSTIVVKDTTRNNGPGTADSSTTKFYWSTNSTYDAGDTEIGSRVIPSLAAGAASSGSTSVTIPAGTCTGTYYIIAVADADNAVLETNEANNTKNKSIKIGADLIVSALTAPLIVSSGQVISVNDITKNSGGCIAGASTTKLYWSANATYDAGDTYLASRAVPSLAAGAANAGSTSVTVPAGASIGTYYIIARADADNAVSETSETNNNKGKSIKIGPDLIVSALTVPTSAARGSTISIKDTTKNSGGDTAGASTTKIYLSTNTTYDAGDAYLASRAIPSLAAGTTSGENTSVIIPSGITTGTYYIIARADADNVVTEANENNNNMYKKITISP